MERELPMKMKQRGMSTFGIVVLLIVLVGGAIGGLKLVPPYLEYFSVKKVLAAMAKQEDLNAMPPEEIRKSFDRRASIDNIKVVSGADLVIDKEGGGTVVSVEYQVEVPLGGNMSVNLNFSDSAGSK